MTLDNPQATWRGPGELTDQRIAQWEVDCDKLLRLLEQCAPIIAKLLQDRPDGFDRELNMQIQLAGAAARNERESISKTADEWRRYQDRGRG